MESQELLIFSDSKGADYHVRLIPKEIRIRKIKRLITGMLFWGIGEQTKTKGQLEMRVISPDGVEDWEKAGSFNKRYLTSVVDEETPDCEYLELKRKGTKIRIFEHYTENGRKTSVFIKIRGEKEVQLKNPTVYRVEVYRVR